MKKLFYPLIVALLAIALIVPAAVFAHTESNPDSTKLIADGGDSETEVGDVLVWNDGTNLHVKYTTTDGWELTQTHLAVADNVSAIPQTKTGNPKPGRFAYKTKHNPAVSEHTYIISLNGWDVGTNLFIAAHAKVEKLSDDIITESLATGVGIDDVLVIAENTTNPGFPVGYPGSYSGASTPSVVIENTANRYSGWPTITGAQWISDSHVEPFNLNEWRLFTRSFSIPPSAINISGTLHIDSDNAEAAKINDNPAMVYGEVYGPFIDDGEWGEVQHLSVDSYLQLGPNTLEVMVRNYHWLNMPGGWRNYTGLVYKMDYEYQLLRTETAWGEGERFTEKGNWATYFTYTVQDWQLVGTIDVLPNGTVYSSVGELASGDQYKLEASGTYRFANWGEAGIADAEYSFRIPGQPYSHHDNSYNTWVSGDDLPLPYTNYLELWYGSTPAEVVWDDDNVVNLSHTYAVYVIGTGSVANFQILDDYYGDNSGSITVGIYHWE